VAADLRMDGVAKHKRQVRQALSQRGLGAWMNDTKWRELLAVIDTLPFPPPYQRKDVLRSEPEPSTFDADVWYIGDWVEGIHPLYSIEWLRIRPRYMEPAGQLLPPTLVDCEAALEQALQSLGQPYEKADGSIWIYGYR